MRGLIFTAGMAALLSGAPALAVTTPALDDAARVYDVAALKAAPIASADYADTVDTDTAQATGLTVISAGDIAAGRFVPTSEGYRTAEATPLRDAFQTAGVAPIRAGHAAAPADGARLISRLPEPATWAMMILGFGAIGLAVRRGLRRAEARFTARLQRIAAGEEA